MSKNTTITLTLSKEDGKRLYEQFKDSASDKVPPYANYQLRVENCVITNYTSNKTVFQGKDAEVYASPFGGLQQTKQKKKQTKTKTATSTSSNTYPQAGSDEVGTGDYFGPVVVCASIVKKEDVSFLQSLGVQDSKAVTDTMILEIAPKLMERLTYSVLVVPPSKYNVVHDTNNMNAIKALLHNQAYLNLSKKEELPSFMIIDQFAQESTYYRYLKNTPKVQRGIHFETKAENKYLSVAAGSIIARYTFLQYFKEMEKEYDMEFKKGAGKEVNKCAKKFVEQYGMDRLHEVAKVHFANTKEL